MLGEVPMNVPRANSSSATKTAKEAPTAFPMIPSSIRPQPIRRINFGAAQAEMLRGLAG